MRVMGIDYGDARTGIAISDLSAESVQFHLGEVAVNGKNFPQWQII